MVFRFATAPLKRRVKKPRAQARPNVLELHEVALAIAKVIDPEAFPHIEAQDIETLVDNILRVSCRQEIALQKARETMAIYDHVLGKRHTIIIKNNGRVTRAFRK